jgi:hypothetical protein
MQMLGSLSDIDRVAEVGKARRLTMTELDEVARIMSHLDWFYISISGFEGAPVFNRLVNAMFIYC